MARRRRSRYSKAGKQAMDDVEAHQRSWVVIPVAEHYEDEAGNVVLRAPRFQGRTGKGLVRVLRRDPEFNLHLDEFGSKAWHMFDGRRTLGEVADRLADMADDEPRIALTRLIMWLKDLKTAGVVRVVTLRKAKEIVK